MRSQILKSARQHRHGGIDQTSQLLACPSLNLTDDTRDVAAGIVGNPSGVLNVHIALHPSEPHIYNIVAKVSGGAPGRRLVFNGHVDTFPLGDLECRSAGPRGQLRDGRLYGLDVSNMKGGLEASLFAFRGRARTSNAHAHEARPAALESLRKAG